MGVYSQSLRKLWKEWNVRTVVLISLTFQVVLVCFGSRRKYNRKLWVRIVVWCAYLAADSLATLALGAISSELLETYDSSGKVNPDVELHAFWAPFLLLHLGGPDTITAYALEDNELWLRHLLGLLFQTGVTVFVCVLAWTGSRLSVLAILMILVGFFKYGERTWVLWCSSSEQLENFWSFKVHRRLLDVNDVSLVEEAIVSQEGTTFLASLLIPFDMPRILNVGRGSFELDDVLEAPAEMISKLIEEELGFMYDLLYTKAMVVYTPCSLAMRLIGFFLTCTVLVLFSIGLTQKNSYSKVDLAITLVLLVGAITIDLYAAFALFSSNWITALLYMYGLTQRNSCYKIIVYCQKYLNKSPSWSNSISQFSLLRFCFGEKHVRFDCVLKHFPRVHGKLKRQKPITYTKVTDTLKEHIIRKVQQKHNEARSSEGDILQLLMQVNVDGALQENSCSEELNPYKGRQIWENIIVWHIATELCYYLEDAEAAANVQPKQREISLHISQYMLSLMVVHPSMLSLVNVAKDSSMLFFQIAVKKYEEMSKAISLPIRKSDDFRKVYKELRLHHQPTGNVADCFGSGGEYHIPAAVWLSLKLDEISDKEMSFYLFVGTQKWKMISDVWLEMLLHVALRSKGNDHAHQLRRGGELLTHVWLLTVYAEMEDHQ
ncbi:uncharacterized protein LOC120013151 isoform X2 [Tripterygium wilfordii]|uniref:uncharacterized protein LOC120013151 isoform X2 n=1 Tax=Tripterygium wilfordii TaxID=458696 RepID=UPI0018F8388E|nr:uncharacterized protein LOC120013151 isoform X2 [Tripterygium wilfordii]